MNGIKKTVILECIALLGGDYSIRVYITYHLLQFSVTEAIREDRHQLTQEDSFG